MEHDRHMLDMTTSSEGDAQETCWGQSGEMWNLNVKKGIDQKKAHPSDVKDRQRRQGVNFDSDCSIS